MSLDFHINALDKLCRICGNRLRKRIEEQRSPLKCCDNTKEILSVFGVSTWGDKPDVHPRCLCDKCGRKIRHFQAGTRTFNPSNTQTKEWIKHPRVSECDICSVFANQSRPGRPSKVKRSWPQQKNNKREESLPFGFSDDNIFPTLCAPQTTSPSLSIVGREEEQSVFTCPICLCILTTPSVQTNCEHYFCAVCLSKYFQHSKSEVVPCPVCKLHVNYNQVSESPRALRIQLQSLVVVCDQCTYLGKYSQIYNHCCPSKKQENRKQPPTIVEAETTGEDKILQAANLLRAEALSHPRGSPIPYAIEQATDRWTWLKLQQGDKTASLKTGGRVSYILLLFFILYSIRQSCANK